MFSNNKEFFAFINSLIKKLDAAEEKEWSSSFKRAMGMSQVPGEVFGALRIVMRDFNKSQVPAKLNMEEEIKTTLETLEGIFKH